LVEPGEVIPAGGKVVTLLDITDVYMTFFLPTAQAGKVAIGADARIVLDALPGLPIPAKVSFADRPAGKLSGGMKQKLGLCCALIHDPDLRIPDAAVVVDGWCCDDWDALSQHVFHEDQRRSLHQVARVHCIVSQLRRARGLHPRVHHPEPDVPSEAGEIAVRHLQNIFRLGVKELRSLRHDKVLLLLVFYAFTYAIYSAAAGTSSELRSASVAVVDEDHSLLSGRLTDAFLNPYFRGPREILASEIDDAMDAGRYTFVVDVPPDF